MTQSDVHRFMKFVYPEPNSGCWLWNGSIRLGGYGAFWDRDSRTIFGAHRASWVLFHGEIPSGEGFHGVCVCHRCDNRACVNPDHLFLGTQTDNVRDAIAKKRRKPGPPVKRGEAHQSAKLTDADVADIRSRAALGERQAFIARSFGVSDALVSIIVNRKCRND